eukprot:scaffold195361_cov43-Cyclotella_meneghiniana.AAC.1
MKTAITLLDYYSHKPSCVTASYLNPMMLVIDENDAGSRVTSSRFGLGGQGAPPRIPPSRPPPYPPCFHRAGNSAPRGAPGGAAP